MLSETAQVSSILDRELIGFLTAVNSEGQPQTSPVWFLRSDDDLVIYNRPASPRLRSVDQNPKVSFNLRGDVRATGVLLVEGFANVVDFGPASGFPGYIEKYSQEIERLGWTPDSFSADYSVALQVTVTRVRAWGLDNLDQ